MKISPPLFYTVLIFLVLIPLILKAELLLKGTVTEGKVLGHTTSNGTRIGKYIYSQILYRTTSGSYILYGPQNVKYPMGESLNIIYDPEDPAEAIILSFSSIYISASSVIPSILIIIWFCTYYVLRREEKRRREEELQL